jgi:alkylation response protein AidB-like acyl-CoA dehydrogenase
VLPQISASSSRLRLALTACGISPLRQRANGGRVRVREGARREPIGKWAEPQDRAATQRGRLGIPAAAIGGGMALVDDAQWWTSTRQQWGQPVGKHQAVAKMISGYMAQLFAMKAMVNVACAFADHKNADIRLEAAAAKYFCSETLWKMYDDYVKCAVGVATSKRSRCMPAASARPASRWACATRASTASSRARRRSCS